MPLRAAVMCLHVDQMVWLHASCPMCGPRTAGPLSTAEQTLMRRIGVLEAEQSVGAPGVQLPDDNRATPHRAATRPETLPEAAARPWTPEDRASVMDGIYGPDRWSW